MILLISISWESRWYAWVTGAWQDLHLSMVLKYHFQSQLPFPFHFVLCSWQSFGCELHTQKHEHRNWMSALGCQAFKVVKDPVHAYAIYFLYKKYFENSCWNLLNCWEQAEEHTVLLMASADLCILNDQDSVYFWEAQFLVTMTCSELQIALLKRIQWAT
jgi:hypothetical protein